MDWRKLKVGQTVWHVNTSPWDYDAPNPSSCLELWKGTVKTIHPNAEYPVDCSWERVGGYANWVKPEWGWCTVPRLFEDTVEAKYENPAIFPTPEEAIETYLEGPRSKLIEQAIKLKGG